MANKSFNEVYDGSEFEVSIATEFDGTNGEWNYVPIGYRRSLGIDKPNATRNVYDKLEFKGKKKVRAENTISITQEFQGFSEGLAEFGHFNGLLLKVEIIPNEGDAPTDNVRYFTNVCTEKFQYESIPDVGEVEGSLEGTFDKEVEVEPDGSEEWAITI